MSNDDKYAICIRCGLNYEAREKLRKERGRIVCKSPDYQYEYKRHAYDF